MNLRTSASFPPSVPVSSRAPHWKDYSPRKSSALRSELKERQEDGPTTSQPPCYSPADQQHDQQLENLPLLPSYPPTCYTKGEVYHAISSNSAPQYLHPSSFNSSDRQPNTPPRLSDSTWRSSVDTKPDSYPLHDAPSRTSFRLLSVTEAQVLKEKSQQQAAFALSRRRDRRHRLLVIALILFMCLLSVGLTLGIVLGLRNSAGGHG